MWSRRRRERRDRPRGLEAIVSLARLDGALAQELDGRLLPHRGRRETDG